MTDESLFTVGTNRNQVHYVIRVSTVDVVGRWYKQSPVTSHSICHPVFELVRQVDSHSFIKLVK